MSEQLRHVGRWAVIVLVGALVTGCPGGKDGETVDTSETGVPIPLDECTPGYGVLKVRVVFGDEYTESISEDTSGTFYFYVLHHSAQPADDANCASSPFQVVASMEAANMDVSDDYVTPSGWPCAWLQGGLEAPDGALVDCFGETTAIKVPECTMVRERLYVYCAIEEDWGDLHAVPPIGPQVVDPRVPASSRNETSQSTSI